MKSCLLNKSWIIKIQLIAESWLQRQKPKIIPSLHLENKLTIISFIVTRGPTFGSNVCCFISVKHRPKSTGFTYVKSQISIQKKNQKIIFRETKCFLFLTLNRSTRAFFSTTDINAYGYDRISCSSTKELIFIAFFEN